MNSKMKFGIVVCFSMLLIGCESSQVVPKPGMITLEEALKSVADGLYQMREVHKDVKFGLLPSEVSVTFNITAKSEDTGKLYVEVGSVPVGGGTGKANAEVGSKLNAERGNQITVKFANLLLTQKGTYFYDKEPENIKNQLNQVETRVK
jgi:hypothetical protein